MILSIGHSTRPITDFLELLQAHGVVQVADVRTVPKSRRHPHFAGAALAAALADAGIGYRHFPELGGLRKPRPDSTNGAWRVEGFRGYADYMETAPSERGIASLMVFAAMSTAVMCAEALWWQCHRQLIADRLAAGGIEVRHIISASPAAAHTLTPFAKVKGIHVRYPGILP